MKATVVSMRTGESQGIFNSFGLARSVLVVTAGWLSMQIRPTVCCPYPVRVACLCAHNK